MTEFWLVRHGQTDWNQEGRYQGSIDISLNEKGVEQAQLVAAQLAAQIGEKSKPVHIEAVYSSPLVRARRTAEIIAERLDLQVGIDKRLVEICQGEWEGRLFTDIRQQHPELVRERLRNPLNARPPGGETAAEVAKRMALAADEIAHRHPGGTVLVVSHGMALASLICQARGIPLQQIYQMIPENAQPVVVQWEDGGVKKDAR